MSLEVTSIVIDAPLYLGRAAPLATQAEAEAGTETAPRTFSPLRMKQAIEALAGTSGPLNNFAATTDPGVGDDSGDGYGVGSVWINVTLDRIWQCQSASSGAAVWERLDETLQHNLSATTDPGVGDDSADGYSVGSKWVNVTLDKVFECLDASAGAAVWAQTNGTSGFSNPMTTRGDVIVGGVSGAPQRVALAGLNKVLTGNGTDAVAAHQIQWIEREIYPDGATWVANDEFLIFVAQTNLHLVEWCAECPFGGWYAPELEIMVDATNTAYTMAVANSSVGAGYRFARATIDQAVGGGSLVKVRVVEDGSESGTETPTSAGTGKFIVRMGFRWD